MSKAYTLESALRRYMDADAGYLEASVELRGGEACTEVEPGSDGRTHQTCFEKGLDELDEYCANCRYVKLTREIKELARIERINAKKTLRSAWRREEAK